MAIEMAETRRRTPAVLIIVGVLSMMSACETAPSGAEDVQDVADRYFNCTYDHAARLLAAGETETRRAVQRAVDACHGEGRAYAGRLYDLRGRYPRAKRFNVDRFILPDLKAATVRRLTDFLEKWSTDESDGRV